MRHFSPILLEPFNRRKRAVSGKWRLDETYVKVLDCINELRGSGLAIVLSTHDPGHAFACADNVALMKRGRIVGEGAPQAAVTPSALHNLYGVEVAVEFMAGAGRNICAPALGRFRQE